MFRPACACLPGCARMPGRGTQASEARRDTGREGSTRKDWDGVSRGYRGTFARFWWILLLGILLAGLAGVAVVINERDQRTYLASTRLLVTSSEAPYFRIGTTDFMEAPQPEVAERRRTQTRSRARARHRYAGYRHADPGGEPVSASDRVGPGSSSCASACSGRSPATSAPARSTRSRRPEGSSCRTCR